uniref:FYVE-type domain-containing protein n=1 Tax=Phytophthora ramorum TaxID=164328 RepID=H3GZR1_PHYRM
MGKGRFIMNPFPEMQVSMADRLQLQDLANDIIMTNLEKYNTFMSAKRKVNPGRWKQIKTRERLTVYAERPESAHVSGGDALSGAGLPMILCVGSMEGKLEDLLYGVMSEDLETMRIKASYVNDVSGAAVLDPIVLPTLEDPLQSLIVKWMELDIPFSSTSLVKNRDYVYLEGTGFVTAQNGDRLGYHLLHSVSFPQTHELPNRIRGNASIIGFWRQSGNNTMEMWATGIFDPCGDMIRMLVVPGMASAFVSSVKYADCGQMRKLAFMLDKAYTEAKQLGTPNKKSVCVTCSAPIGRRLGDFAKSDSTCKLCFGHVCHACKVVRKLSFVDPDLQLSRRKVTFCTSCISSVTSMSAMDVARASMLSAKKGVAHYPSTNTSSTVSGDNGSEVSYSSSSMDGAALHQPSA